MRRYKLIWIDVEQTTEEIIEAEDGPYILVEDLQPLIQTMHETDPSDPAYIAAMAELLKLL